MQAGGTLQTNVILSGNKNRHCPVNNVGSEVYDAVQTVHLLL